MTLTISGGNSVTLDFSSLADTGTDSQTLAFGSSNTATQTTLEIAGGNSLTLQASGSLLFSQTGTSTLELTVAETDASKIIDSDGDTQIEVERGSDDDTIRLSTAGVERMQIGSDVTNITTDLSVTATDTTLNSNLTVANTTALGSDLTVTGNTAIMGDLGVASNATVTGTLEVTGNTTLTSDLAVTGSTTLTDLAVTGNAVLAGDLTFRGNTRTDGTLTANSTTTLNAALVDGVGSPGGLGQYLSSTGTRTQWLPIAQTDSQTLAFGSSNTATQTTLEIAGGNSLTLQASGSLLFSQTGTSTLELTVAETDASKIIDSDGDTQIEVERGNDDDTIRLSTAGVERMQIGSDVTNITTDLSVTATDTTLNSNLTVANTTALGSDLTVTGNTAITGDLGVASNATVTGTLEVTGNTTLTSDLVVVGNTTLARTTLSGVLLDSYGRVGGSGEVLTSTGTSTQWVTTGALPAGRDGSGFLVASGVPNTNVTSSTFYVDSATGDEYYNTGGASWTLLPSSDNQTLTASALSATNTMTLTISGGNSVTLDFSSLADTGTDSQTLAFGSSNTATANNFRDRRREQFNLTGEWEFVV